MLLIYLLIFSDFNYQFDYSDKMALICIECNFRAKSRTFLASHIYNKHRRPFLVGADALNSHKCHLCFRVYNLEGNLRRHLSQECGVLPKFQCIYCPYISKRKHDLQCHIGRRHPNILENK